MSGKTVGGCQLVVGGQPVTYTGQLRAEALAQTFLHVEEWMAENGLSESAPVELEADVVVIARRYMETGELRFGEVVVS